MSVHTSDSQAAGTSSTATLLATVGIPLAIAITAIVTGRRGTPLVVDRATLLIKTRTLRSNGAALAGELASHVGAIALVATASGLIMAPELERSGSWVPDVGTRVVALVGLAIAAFALALAALGPLRSARAAVPGVIYLVAAAGWATAVRNPTDALWIAVAIVAIGLISVAVSSKALDHLQPERLNARAQVVEDMRVGWFMMTPLHVLAILRVARAPDESSRSIWSSQVRSTWLSIAALLLAVVAVASMFDGAPLRIGLILGVFAYLLGGVVASPLTFVAQVSRGAPHTIGARHLTWRTIRQWAPAVALGAIGAFIIDNAHSDIARVAGVVFATVGTGWCCALWSSVSRDLDLGSLTNVGGLEQVGRVMWSRWLLPPLVSVLVAVAATSAASPGGLVMETAVLLGAVAVVVLAPLIAVRAR